MARANVAAVGNVQIDPRTGLLDHAGVFFDLRGAPYHAWKGRGSIPPGEYGEWNAVTAACLLIPTDRFKELGGFDEGYRNSYEDVDLCVRLRSRGYRLLVSHRSVIEHYGRTSPGRKRHDLENRARFLDRWAATAAAWGREEWPRQYLQKYARRWWAANPLRVARALWMLVSRS
jgi:GT2 family glycosyltransferase